ncbi:disease resistance protein RLM3-like [Punica granatum]|uniref:Disease resistance protein RLM3-like n=1 Tax=Punica granatum TaxID=22663 RepID=A0A6P8EB96_PUNGR|nr:disease resistance protein RLM3-like [Punica granatum]
MGKTSTQPLLALASPKWKYDVFVSFRGEDARKGFISHLFCAFELVDINHDHMVIPIFYDVEPSEVRKQEGEFGREMESYATMHGEANMAV